jgi:glycerol kinase
MQLQADLAGVRVRRPADLAATARGAAGLAGLGAGVFADPRTPAALRDDFAEFEPRSSAAERGARMAAWRRAVGRVR